jgi:maltooligosyltrehalose synthase
VPGDVLSTYRVQLRAEFDFDAAAAVADYLSALGVSHLYCSPYLQAAAGSTHGYDVVDPTRVSEELGGEAGHQRLCLALAEHGLGQILDVVPNHMAITGPDNRWWWDVLENGPASRYADTFDVDWAPREERLRNLVLLPILDNHYGRVLEAGELRLGRDGGRFEVSYRAHRMPVAPRSLDEPLRAAAERCGSAELAFLADAFGELPEATATDRESGARRHRDKEVLAGLLARLAGERHEVAAAVDGEVAAINGDADRLDRLLSRQNYRLAWWRLAGRELDYRRFFDVSTLAGLRVEDTAFYVFNRLAALDEVGGDPGRFGVSPEELHRRCQETAAHSPRTMLTLSTHDTKRSGDVRARLYLLSEIPERWAEAVRRWFAHNARHRHGGVPDADTEYLLYQTLVGAWPLDRERAAAYMEKAAREARTHTSWHRPDAAWETALRRFVADLDADAEFQRDLAELAAPLVGPGRVNSLAQTLLELAAPGVPDLYQGCELWDSSLVDPDNRRPVDYALRRRLLARLPGASPEEVMAGMEEGLPKLWLVRQALHLRRRRPHCFGPGAGYLPLPVAGARATHAVAFCRAGEVAVAVPRLVLGLAGDWGDTTIELPPERGRWWHELTGETFAAGPCRAADLMGRFPVALLSSQAAGAGAGAGEGRPDAGSG